MEDYRSFSHTAWQCKYPIIFIPRCRRKKLYGVVRRELGSVFHRLAEQKGCKIIEGHILPDHVHMLISIPPKLAVSSVVGFIMGKSAIHVARFPTRSLRQAPWFIFGATEACNSTERILGTICTGRINVCNFGLNVGDLLQERNAPLLAEKLRTLAMPRA